LEVERDKRRELLGKLALLSATLLWGASFMITKSAAEEFPKFLMLSIRFLVGALLLAVIFFPRLRLIDLRFLWQGALTGVLLFSGYITQTIGLTLTTPGKTAFLTTFYCIMVPFVWWIVKRRRPDGYNFAAAAVCVVGIGLVSLEAGFTVGLGDLLVLLCGVLFAIHIVAVGLFGQNRDPMMFTMLQFAVTGLIFLLLWAIFESRGTDISVLARPNMLFDIIFLTVGATTLGLLLQNIGQKYVEPSSAALILSLESVFGVLFSIVFYHERMTVRLIAGFSLIFIAIVISETKLGFLKKRERRQDEALQ